MNGTGSVTHIEHQELCMSLSHAKGRVCLPVMLRNVYSYAIKVEVGCVTKVQLL